MDDDKTQNAAIAGLQSEMREMKDVMGKVADALTRLALVEDRQHSVAQTTNRILEQVEALRERQHAGELANTTNGQNAIRIAELDQAVRELHVDNERHKASLKTASTLIKAAWAAGVGMAAIVAWLASHLPIH